MELPSDLIDLLAAFATDKVEYLLIGGQAVALHGHPRFTKDADLWLRDTPENIQRCQSALRAFGAPEEVVEGIAASVGLDVVWMGHPPARIDLVKEVPGGDFARAWADRVQMEIAETRVDVVNREELIRLKRASGRPQDLVDAGLLGGDG
ncbi:MAG: hypothetical protein KC416_04845 [Myxococcales bacterium]|nr:hypothetical protein [Myxococcales bacterium]